MRISLVNRGGLGEDCGDRSLEKVNETGESDVTTPYYLDGWSALEERDGDDALQTTYVNGARLAEYVLRNGDGAGNSVTVEPGPPGSAKR